MLTVQRDPRVGPYPLGTILMKQNAPEVDAMLACTGLKWMFMQHMAELQRRLGGKLDTHKILRSVSLRDFDRHLTVEAYGYKTVDDYYMS